MSKVTSIHKGREGDRPKARLLDLLARHAYRYDSTKPFLLASGGKSDEYINCKDALSLPETMEALAKVVYPLLPGSVEAIGGLTMGADPIAVGVSLFSANRPRRVRWFSVRKEAKKHGLRREIEGGVPAGARVAIVDDVVTQGGSTLDAIRKCRSAGLSIKRVIVLVDRQQGGLEKIKAEVGADVRVIAIFTKAQVHARWKALQ